MPAIELNGRTIGSPAPTSSKSCVGSIATPRAPRPRGLGLLDPNGPGSWTHPGSTDDATTGINRALDDTLFLRRAHSVGHERQQLNLPTYALTVNSLAVHRHRAIDERPARHARRLSAARGLDPPTGQRARAELERRTDASKRAEAA